ncbi:raffinose/stachyose/melibiose transport system substrate-binding protein [Kineococcus xinjiangensis]|uniref:Raffinose/stachyose/melibiose transport system substrate-binding protein n=1 Tax=Kineococcus xinjiangensis TaxID=512762 RepID=A0A2S6ISZ6_9ACTN|nr:ABC transporter substrate-binding protein [Kineococcus xinjiangensis]PPK97369.1 raffinose/stachyose/melibiose transport system substrate-binding protein [Kineococcus xinjiangensis]
MSPRAALRRSAAAIALAVLPLSLAACGGATPGAATDAGPVSITMLVDGDPSTVAPAEQLAKDFQAENPDVTVVVEKRPGGAEGDEVVRTRLEADSPDVLLYNSGSLFQQINPYETLQPLKDSALLAAVDADYLSQVSVGGQLYGVPLGSANAGGVLYNRAVYERLNLQVPATWEEFLANSQRIREAGITPVIQTYGDPWTSQLLVLGDFHNVAAADPGFADAYSRGTGKFATHAAAGKGFQHLEQIHRLGLHNDDHATAQLGDGLRMLALGEGAHYPMLSAVATAIMGIAPERMGDIGFFALPGDDAAANGATAWYPPGLFIPKATKGAELEAAQRFLAYVASAEGCESISKAATPAGPYLVETCELPSDVPQVTRDVQAYFDSGAHSPALEFLSPVKGPDLERFATEAGSGVRSGADAAALYDADVRAQAGKLGLEGW